MIRRIGIGMWQEADLHEHHSVVSLVLTTKFTNLTIEFYTC